jgi:hypothetical protein
MHLDLTFERIFDFSNPTKNGTKAGVSVHVKRKTKRAWILLGGLVRREHTRSEGKQLALHKIL